MLRDAVGFPDLSLLSDGSQVMRKSYPFAPYEAYAAYLRIIHSEPLDVIVDGERAIAISKNPVRGYHPIMLVKSDSKWLIDLSSMVKNMFFNRDGNFYLRNNNNPYLFAFNDSPHARYYDIDAIELPSEVALKNALDDLRNSTGSRHAFQLAELLFRNAFATIEALEFYNKAILMDPENTLYRETLIDRYRYLGMDNLIQPHLEKLTSCKSPSEDLNGQWKEDRAAAYSGIVIFCAGDDIIEGRYLQVGRMTENNFKFKQGEIILKLKHDSNTNEYSGKALIRTHFKYCKGNCIHWADFIMNSSAEGEILDGKWLKKRFDKKKGKRISSWQKHVLIKEAS